MDKNLKIGDITLSQVEAAYKTIEDALDAANNAITNNEYDNAVPFLALMGILQMGLSARFNATVSIASACLDAKKSAKPKPQEPEPVGRVVFPVVATVGEKS